MFIKIDATGNSFVGSFNVAESRQLIADTVATLCRIAPRLCPLDSLNGDRCRIITRSSQLIGFSAKSPFECMVELLCLKVADVAYIECGCVDAIGVMTVTSLS